VKETVTEQREKSAKLWYTEGREGGGAPAQRNQLHVALSSTLEFARATPVPLIASRYLFASYKRGEVLERV
jgi:hypothetical protein